MNLNIMGNLVQSYLSGAIINILKNNLYIFTCSAYSNPGVSLTLYDTNTRKVLSLPNNTASTLNCNSFGIGCTTNITVSLDFTNSQLYNLTSVTCEAKSLNVNIYLSTNLTQFLIVSPTSNKSFSVI